MAAEKRRNPRRTVTYPAYIDLGDGTPLRECSLRDASQEGALLAVADPNSLPDEFTLALSSDGAARRRCEIAWRNDGSIGVRFVRETRDHMPTGRTAGQSASAAPADKVDIDTITPR
jgi:hypothetical protein